MGQRDWLLISAHLSHNRSADMYYLGMLEGAVRAAISCGFDVVLAWDLSAYRNIVAPYGGFSKIFLDGVRHRLTPRADGCRDWETEVLSTIPCECMSLRRPYDRTDHAEYVCVAVHNTVPRDEDGEPTTKSGPPSCPVWLG